MWQWLWCGKVEHLHKLQIHLSSLYSASLPLLFMLVQHFKVHCFPRAFYLGQSHVFWSWTIEESRENPFLWRGEQFNGSDPQSGAQHHSPAPHEDPYMFSRKCCCLIHYTKVFIFKKQKEIQNQMNWDSSKDPVIFIACTQLSSYTIINLLRKAFYLQN